MPVWFDALLAAWDECWSKATPPSRDEALKSLCNFSSPTQGWLYRRQSADAGVAASVLVIRHDPSRPHRELLTLARDGEHDWQGDAPPLKLMLDLAESLYLRVSANWTENRVGRTITVNQIVQQRLPDKDVPSELWLIPGSPEQLDIAGLTGLAFYVRDSAGLGSAERVPRGPHLYEADRREFVSIARWLALQADALMSALGLNDGWWCGINLPRRAIFGGDTDGDVDIIAGPLVLNCGPREQEQLRARVVADLSPLDSPDVVQHLCALSAADAGLVQWPPAVDYLVAVEAKASWFDPVKRAWKATRMGEANKVKGVLEQLVCRGFDRVAFLHIAATKPSDMAGNPWLVAAAAAAEAMRCGYPLVFPPSEAPSCGYFMTLVGAVPFATEDEAGAGGTLKVLQPAPALVGRKQPWRQELAQRLKELSQPKRPRVFIRACSSPGCGRWSHDAFPTVVSCPYCGAPFRESPSCSSRKPVRRRGRFSSI